jgi:hypothetical protein
MKALCDIEFSKKDKIKGVILPREVTEDLAYLCGILAGDGHINIREEKHDWLIKCVGNPKDEQEFYQLVIKPLFRRIFGMEINLKLLDNGETYGFCTWSRAIVRFLTEFVGMPHGSKYATLKIPTVFVKNDLVGEFIRGVADTDFYLGLKRGSKKRPLYPVVVGSSKSRTFIDEIAVWLKQKGFHVNVYERRQLDPRFKAGFSITHTAELAGHKNFQNWMEIIGFSNPKHIVRARKVFESYRKKEKTGWKDQPALIAESGFEPLTSTCASISLAPSVGHSTRSVYEPSEAAGLCYTGHS